jgi:hypothetical protein
MMTIQQTIDIPADRWLHLELPKTVPSGKFELRLIFTPLQAARKRQPEDFAHLLRDSPKTIEEAIAEARRKTVERLENPAMDSMKKYAGCLKDSSAFEGDPVEIQRRMRDETLERLLQPPPSLEEFKREAAEKTANRIACGREPFEEARKLLNGRRLFDGVDGVEYQRRLRDEWPE